MTLLVLDPCTLRETVPGASLTRPVRVRMVCQVVQYVDRQPAVVVRAVGNLTGQTSSASVAIDLSNVSEQVSADITSRGSIISMEAFYDGQAITPVSLEAVDGQVLLSASNLETLRGVASLEPI